MLISRHVSTTTLYVWLYVACRPLHARRSASAGGKPPSATMIAALLGPVLAEVLWYRAWFRSYRCRPDSKVQHPRHPRLVHVFGAPIRRWLQHGNALPPQRRLARELPPLLLPSGVRVEGKDQRADLPPPVPPPALAPKDRHHTGHAGSEQRQRIKGALADPQRTRASLQRGGVKVTLGTREMVMALGLRHLLGSGILVMLTD